ESPGRVGQVLVQYALAAVPDRAEVGYPGVTRLLEQVEADAVEQRLARVRYPLRNESDPDRLERVRSEHPVLMKAALPLHALAAAVWDHATGLTGTEGS